MKSIIKDFQVKVVELELKKSWKISLYEQKTRPHCIIKIVTEDGFIGYGEASPSPAFMGETGYTMELAINKYLGPSIIGENIFNIDEIHDKLDKAIYGNYAAKSAIDMALYDLMGKTLEVPVYKLLGGKYRDQIQLSWVVGMQDLEDSIEEAKERLAEGYKVIKIKVGISPDRDIELLSKVREKLGYDFPIRLDANQGYDYRTALTTFKKLEEFHLESIEQPVKRWDIKGLKMLRERLDTPIMADESISNFHDVVNVVNNDACDIVNIKVGKVGGLSRAKKIANYLEANGLHATAGSNLEVGLGAAASLHFVASTKNVDIPNDLYLGNILHKNDIIKTNYELLNGCLKVPENPGLGIEVNEDIFR